MISLIIPVFNVDVALLKCLLESITLKSDFEFEIIIVDDCSTNIDLLNFESYIENQPHCKVISTGKNSGPGVARNIGIENANGNWCMFADADDFYSQGAIKIVNSTLINNNPNAIIFDYNIVAGNTVKMKSLSNSDQYISKSEIQELSCWKYRVKQYMEMCLFVRYYKREQCIFSLRYAQWRGFYFHDRIL